ncbi:MAG: multidrug efflux pump subunit AcrB [Arenicella sp.]|jgi:multidrug efflux pump subunit AcrB
MIEWFARNSVASNLLMFGIVIAGITSALNSVPVETFPTFESDTVTVSTQFRGATPKTIEDGITLRIEEAISDVEGIEELTSRSSEGSSSVIAEINDGYNKRNVLDDIKVRVDALNTLPFEAEKPVVSLNTRNRTVIWVAVQGKVDAKLLRTVAGQFREGLLTKSEISNVDLQGVAEYQMNIEVSPQTLDAYNITLAQIGLAIRSGARDVSAGNVQTLNGDILVRSDGQAYSRKEFAAIPILSNSEGKPITLGDIASIDDGFEEKSLITTFNGTPAIMVQVRRVGEQSAIEVSQQTKDYMAKFSENLPLGVKIDYWDDDSGYLKTRIGTVLNSAWIGGILVMILLSLFLRPAVASWVFLGIPVSFMGAFLFMPFVGGTFNVVSLFAFIMVIGIVVDDAIVTGENIYRRMREGMDPQQAAIIGTQEITVPVTFGILTTIVAFLPLSYLQGTRYDFIGSQIPMVVIPVLLMSLVESKLILPSHMSHIKVRRNNSQMGWFGRTQQKISYGLEIFIERYYSPFLARCVRNQAITLTILVAFSAIVVAAISIGHIRYSPFPYVESDTVRINLTMPESTGFETTNKHIQDIVEHFKTVQDKYTDPETGASAVINILATSGSQRRTIKSNLGSVRAELQTSEIRVGNVSASQIGREVRALIGQIPGAQSLSVSSRSFGDSAPINVELSGDDPAEMYLVIEKLKEKFKSYPGVYDIQDNFSGGKEELKLSLKPQAYTLGLNLSDVAQQVRSAVFGFQAQRIQRGRDELRVMVRYPLEYRSSMQDLNQLAIRVPNSSEQVLLSDIAEVTPFESPSTLYRLDRRSILNITADADKDVVNLPLILSEIDRYLAEAQQQQSNLSYRFDGEAEDAAQTNQRLTVGLVLVLMAIYALLAIPFKSYGQPLIVMSVIPFGLIGAVVGHFITGQNLSVMSVFGMLALVGVLVNDSLVLVDYINKRRQQGVELVAAVLSSAAIRFRPVILTSITTFAGLAPILLDGSQQAKWLKPMATSLAFGIVFATIITLLVVPINYLVARKFKYFCIETASKGWATWLVFWNKEDAKPLR